MKPSRRHSSSVRTLLIIAGASAFFTQANAQAPYGPYTSDFNHASGPGHNWVTKQSPATGYPPPPVRNNAEARNNQPMAQPQAPANYGQWAPQPNQAYRPQRNAPANYRPNPNSQAYYGNRNYPPGNYGQGYGRPMNYGPRPGNSRFSPNFNGYGPGSFTPFGSGKPIFSNNGNRKFWGKTTPETLVKPSKENWEQAWDDMMLAPSRMGEMPGGWYAPEVYVPNPVDMGDQFKDNMKDLPQQIKDMNVGNAVEDTD